MQLNIKFFQKIGHHNDSIQLKHTSASNAFFSKKSKSCDSHFATFIHLLWPLKVFLKATDLHRNVPDEIDQKYLAFY